MGGLGLGSHTPRHFALLHQQLFVRAAGRKYTYCRSDSLQRAQSRFPARRDSGRASRVRKIRLSRLAPPRACSANPCSQIMRAWKWCVCAPRPHQSSRFRPTGRPRRRTRCEVAYQEIPQNGDAGGAGAPGGVRTLSAAGGGLLPTSRATTRPARSASQARDRAAARSRCRPTGHLRAPPRWSR